MPERARDPRPRRAAPSSRFERRRRRNRQALLEAAIELFQQRGVRAVKLEEICARADVAPRTFFNHFESREHLYRAIARQRAEQLAALCESVGQDRRTVSERLPELFASIAAYLGARPLYRELVGEMLHVRIDGGSEGARSRPLGRAAQRLLREAAERGEVTRRFAPELLADLLLGALTTAIANWCADERYDLETELAESARALLVLFTAGADRAPDRKPQPDDENRRPA